MTRTCETCGEPYDDAARSTCCPHPRFLTETAQARKDLALTLMGCDLRWAHDPDGAALTVQWVTWDGMVGIRGYAGLFAPHLFRRVA